MTTMPPKPISGCRPMRTRSHPDGTATQVRYIARRIHERLPATCLRGSRPRRRSRLIDALNKFDLSKQVQFSSYAKFRIRGAILDSLRELDWSPRELRRKGRLVDSLLPNFPANSDARPTNMSSPGDGIGLRDCKRCSPSSTVSKSAACASSRRATARGEPHDITIPRNPRRRRFFSACARRRSNCWSRQFPNCRKRNSVCWALLLEELTMKEVGAALGIGESPSRRFIPWRCPAACPLNF